MRRVFLALAFFAWWFLFFDPATNTTKQIGPFATKKICEKVRADLEAAATSSIYLSSCWVFD